MRIILSENMYDLLFENTIGLPKNILKQLLLKNTSLSEHPCFPPDIINSYEIDLLSNYYEILSKKILDKTNTLTVENINQLMSDSYFQLQNCEKGNECEIEILIIKILVKIFNLSPEDINFECSINDKNIDDRNDTPEETQFQFNDIHELELINKLVYKKRLLNSIIIGVSSYLVTQMIDEYLKDIYKINNELPKLYNDIMLYNEFLMYHCDNYDSDGSYNIQIGSDKPTIKVQATSFIGLLYESIKSILDFISFKSISDELPECENKNNILQFIISKSDFKQADLWDNRFGIPLITNIINIIPIELLPYTLKELISVDIDTFNINIKEILINSKKGVNLIEDIISAVNNNLRYVKLENDISTKNKEFKQEDIYFNIDEL